MAAPLVTAEILRDEGFEVVEARTGDEAARLLDGSESFDILFTDVRMPVTLDGVNLAIHLRRRHPAIPVLIVSGYAAHLTSRLGELQPPAVFISKPYDLAKVVSALNGMTGRVQPSRPEMAMAGAPTSRGGPCSSAA